MGRATNRNNAPRRAYQKPAVLLSVLIIVGVVFFMLYESQAPQGYGQIVINWRLTIIIHDVRTAHNYTLPIIGAAGGLWVNHTLDQYGPDGYAPVSVRDASGTVLIQSRIVSLCQAICPYTFNDLFNIAGLKFNRQCVPDGRNGEYCSGPSTPPPLMVDISPVNGNPDKSCFIDGRLGLSNGKVWLITLGVSEALSKC